MKNIIKKKSDLPRRCLKRNVSYSHCCSIRSTPLKIHPIDLQPIDQMFWLAEIKLVEISTVVCVQQTPGSLNIETETAARLASADASPQGYDFWLINDMLDTEHSSK